MRIGSSFFVATLLALLHAVPAQAQTRGFVAAQGSDSNPCTFALPCRTFQHAHDVVAAGGEIDVLDPAGYGTLSISKAISIQGHGFAGITATSGTAITISAGAVDRVTLRGLLLDGGGTGTIGIRMTSGLVDIDECVVRNFAAGIADDSNGGSLFVSNSLFAHLNDVAIQIAGGGDATTHASISRVEVNDSSFGIEVLGNHLVSSGAVVVTVSDSNIAGSSGVGVSSGNPAGSLGVVNVLVTRSSVVEGGTGVRANGGNAMLRLNQSTIAHNATGWATLNGGQMTSWGNNAFDDNGNGDGALTITLLR